MSDAVLAIEWSTRRVSVALGGDADSLELPRFRAVEAVGRLQDFLDARGLAAGGVDEIRVGRGPGNYSGVRQALAWAAGAAAPGGIRTTAVSSGRAQARRWLREHGGTVAVLGDARRGMWWGAVFGEEVDVASEWRLDTPEIWRERVAGIPVISAEAERLEGLTGVVPDFPCASDLLEVEPDEPMEPLYLHPPVG